MNGAHRKRLQMERFRKAFKVAAVAVLFAVAACVLSVSARAQSVYSQRHESARSDKFTGGVIERAALEAGQPDIRITVNVPAFQLTLWQDGKEVKTYYIGVGMKDYPLYIGDRKATAVIWNPAWIPPSSDWVKGIKPGTVIKASDPRNPLGRLKIPLGDSYLIHQAKGTSDLGNLVSHGCVRMLLGDLYDLAEKIAAARSLPVTKKRIEAAKRSRRTLAVELETPVPVDINYDTQVVEGGVLYLYPDVYGRKTSTVASLREELRTSNVDDSRLDDATLKAMLAQVTRKQKYVVSLDSIEADRALADGQTQPLIPSPARPRRATKRNAAAR